MGKVAFLFSGQGSQYVGMGKEIAETFDVSKSVFDKADQALGFSLSQLCFEESDGALNLTENTQPAVLTTSIAILEAVKEFGIEADVVAGLSLGEYSALVSSGVMSFEEAVQLVRKRGRYMQDAVPTGEGTMAAILGLDRETVEKVCEDTEGIVQPANYNCKGQIVIAGEVPAVEAACAALTEAGAKRAIMLKVSGPFHTTMLEPAAMNLGKELEGVEINAPDIPYITNVTADYVEAQEPIKELLTKQVMSPVYWEDTIKRMIHDGVETFIEIGPGKSLSSFVKKIDRSKSIYNVEDLKSLSKLVQKVKEVDLCLN